MIMTMENSINALLELFEVFAIQADAFARELDEDAQQQINFALEEDRYLINIIRERIVRPNLFHQ